MDGGLLRVLRGRFLEKKLLDLQRYRVRLGAAAEPVR